MSATAAALELAPGDEAPASTGPGALAVVRVELWKLRAQWRVRIAFALALVGPFAFAALVTVTGTVPADTVFGRQVLESAPAIPLVALGFAGSWAIPLLVSLVAGDIVSSEDHHGTWPTVLTRSVRARAVLAGKVLAAAAYTVAVLVVLALAAVLAGLAFAPHAELIGLSGNRYGLGDATGRALLAWLGVLPGGLAFAAVAVLVSVATRNSLAGIVGPVLLGLVGQLLTLVDGSGPIASLLPSASFLAWHGLFAQPAWPGRLGWADLAAAVWCALALVVAGWSFRRRWSVR